MARSSQGPSEEVVVVVVGVGRARGCWIVPDVVLVVVVGAGLVEEDTGAVKDALVVKDAAGAAACGLGSRSLEEPSRIDSFLSAIGSSVEFDVSSRIVWF